MNRFRVTAGLLALLLSCTSLAAGPDGLWTTVEQAWVVHDAGTILAYASDPVRLGINAWPDYYSRDQAQAKLQEYFNGIETVSFQFDDKSRSTVVGAHRYRRNGQEHETGQVRMTAEEREAGWVITEIYVQD